VAKQAQIGEVEAHGLAVGGSRVPSSSAKESYARYLLSAKCLRIIFAIDESTSPKPAHCRARQL
jgi:hypothetical protein